MDTPKKVSTVFLHTSKMYRPNYAETFRMITDTIGFDKAKFVVVMSTQTVDCGMQTKEEILSVAEKLFKIYEEE